MIPVTLSVRNFLSYGGETEMLDFRGCHIICLSGENGHGKSALLDAMTWALFGKARAPTEDELLHHGATEMQVIFDLELNGSLYRVSRQRLIRGKTKQTQLELLVQESDGSWRPLTGNSVRETERGLEHLLGMNYQTFINSAFLLQGRADEFTVKPPSERKKVLADVLNLEAYERLAVRARDRRQEWERNRDLIERELETLDHALTQLPVAQEALAAAEAQQASAQAALPPAQEQLQRLRDDWQRVQRLQEDLSRAEEQHRRISDRVREQQEKTAGIEARRAAALATLATREATAARYAQWQAQATLAAEQTQRLMQLRPLQAQQRALQDCITREQHQIERQADVLVGKLQGCVQETAKGKEAESALDGLLAELDALDGVADRLRETKERQGTLKEEIAGLKAEGPYLEKALTQLRGRYTTLGNGEAPCPTCNQPLSAHSREALRAEMQAEADKCKAQQREAAAAVAAREATLRRLTKEIGELDGKVKRVEQLRLTEATLREKIFQAECAQRQAGEWEQGLGLLRAQLADQQFAIDERRQLQAIEAQIAAVGYDAAAHDAASRQRDALADAEQQQRRVEEAAQALRGLEETLEQMRQALKNSQEQQASLEAQLAAMAAQLAGSAAIRDELRLQEETVRGLEAERLTAEAAVVRARGDLERLHEQQQQREQRAKKLKEAQEQQGVFAELTESFGRNGVQAMLIDEAIPIIEEEANALLGAMTEQRLGIKLETQRQTQKQTTVETLDVRISDELGTRNYELYSGGEAFRVNFALRVALSRLLAHRAGTRLQTLIIDEGFGSQDANGRERLRGALASVAADFACIIVITHLDEMKDWFPTRVEVQKDSSGSHIRVIAA